MQNTNSEQNTETTEQVSDNDNNGQNAPNVPDSENVGHNRKGAPQLSAIELRVLGVLMEKQLTTPDQYPLTLNSVITACNQKSSREPVSNYNQGEVHRALQELDNKNFVRKERSSRSEKFSQQFMHHLELGRKQQALLCVMMLRGPQTLSELSTRTQRMCEFTDKDELEHAVDRLCNRETPYAIRLGQQPGQRGERIAHLFSGTPTVYSSVTSAENDTQAVSNNVIQPVNTDNNSQHDETVAILELEVTELRKTVDALSAESAELKQQLAALYSLTGHSVQK